MFCCLFKSCDAIKIVEATKQKVFHEDSFSSSGYCFSVYIKVHKITIVNAVGLGSACSKREDYEISHLGSGKILLAQEVLKKDHYLIQFFIDENRLPFESNQICIYCHNDNKPKLIKSSIINEQDLQVKSKKRRKVLQFKS